MKRILLYLGVLFIPLLCVASASAQAPNISYTPSTNVYTVGTAISALTPANTGGAVPAVTYGTVTTFAGTANTTGTTNGTGTAARFNAPRGLGIDASGNLYIADAGNSEIRKATSGAVVTLFAGSTTGVTGTTNATGNAARFNTPYDVTVDGSGNLYVADQANNEIRMITPGAVVTLLAGSATGVAGRTNGTGNAAQFSAPEGIIYDPASGNIFVSDFTNNEIREVTPAGVVTLFAGSAAGTAGNTNATGNAARFSGPIGIDVDASGNLYVADQTNNLIRKITPAGVVTTLAGSGAAGAVNGTGTAASFNGPRGIAVDASGNVYVGDNGNNLIRMITPAGVVTTIAGSGTAGEVNAVGIAAQFNAPRGLRIDPSSGNLFVADRTGETIRKVITTGYTISPALPAGLTFNVTTGIITGTPTAVSAATNYTITAYNASGSSITTVSIACGQTVDWKGATSTAWATASNWSTNPTLPGVNDAVRIGVVTFTNQPTLSANTTVNSITFGSFKQGTLSIATGATLTINNNLTINTGATGAAIKGAGTAAVVIAPGATVAVNGTGVLTFTSPLSFTLQSSAAGDASIGQITSTNFVVPVAISITVQRYLTGGSATYRGYRLLSSPVTSGSGDYTINYLKNSIYLTGTTTTGGFDNVVAANPTLYLYRENLTTPSNTTFTGSNFRGISDITTTPLYGMNDVTYPTTNIPVGNGLLCFFRGNRASATFAAETVVSYVPQSVTLSTSGTLNIGNVTVKDWFTPASPNLSYTSTSPVAGFNLVGNPYPSAIDWDTFQTTALGNGGIYGVAVSTTMYALDPVSHNYGAYTAGTGGVGTNNASNIISSGQGFFVKSSTTSAQLVFTESAKTSSFNTGLSLLMGKPVNTASNQYLRLRLAEDSVNTDEIMIRFNRQATTNYNQAIDAIYQPGFGSVSLSGITNDKVNLAIAALPFPRLQAESLGLNVNANTDGIYSLSLKDIVSVPRLFDVWLMDKYKGDSLDMRQNITYRFNIYKTDSTSFGSKRFTVVIRQNPAYAYRLLDFTAAKLREVRKVQITWNTVNEGNYTNFTVERSVDNGKTFNVLGAADAAGSGKYSILDNSPVTGQNFYRLKQEDINNTITYSKVVGVQYSDLSNTLLSNKLSIYPNPVSNNISLAIPQKSTDNNTSYNIKFMNSSGIVVKQITSSQPSWQGSVSNLKPGTYVVQVLDSKSETLVGQTKFIKL